VRRDISCFSQPFDLDLLELLSLPLHLPPKKKDLKWNEFYQRSTCIPVNTQSALCICMCIALFFTLEKKKREILMVHHV
jgi:hypothetical protein